MDLILKIIISLVASIYYVQRLKNYIDNRKNNNVTGDVLFRWESVSLMDKYHIRERFFGGSKLRIKRDARRHEIKYYWISYIPALIFICLSAGIEAEVRRLFSLFIWGSEKVSHTSDTSPGAKKAVMNSILVRRNATLPS